VNAKEKKFRYNKEKRPPGGFVPLPFIVIRSQQFASLSAYAVKLLMDLLAQYNGDTNGDMTATWSVMKRRGWKSRDTLAKALAELIESGFVAQTRQGGRHAPSLYGVTFYSLDEKAKLDVTSSTFPRGAWARAEAPEQQKRYHAQRVNSGVGNTPAVSKGAAANAN
jgi:hypothetical protein